MIDSWHFKQTHSNCQKELTNWQRTAITVQIIKTKSHITTDSSTVSWGGHSSDKLIPSSVNWTIRSEYLGIRTGIFTEHHMDNLCHQIIKFKFSSNTCIFLFFRANCKKVKTELSTTKPKWIVPGYQKTHLKEMTPITGILMFPSWSSQLCWWRSQVFWCWSSIACVWLCFIAPTSSKNQQKYSWHRWILQT